MSKKENIEKPSLIEWKELYDAAIAFKEMSPWNWMWDSDLFGVQNPADGEIGYCCVMGKAGEVFGIAVYLGTEGLVGYLKIQQGSIDVKDDEILHTKRCLVVTFEDKRYLQRPDLNVVKKLNLELKGRNIWPLFRSYRPGYFPWYLTKEEAVFLTLCLSQAKAMGFRFKKDPNLFNSPDGQSYLVRSQEKMNTGVNWKDIWVKPAPLKKIVIMTKTFNTSRLDSITEKLPQQKQIWEMDYFYAPAYIAEKGKRPYFPLAFLFLDSYSHFIFHTHMTTPDKYLGELHEQFLISLEKAGVIPQEIRVKKEELLTFLEPLADRLGIKMRLAKNLAALDDARKHMFEYFGKRR